MNKNLPITTYGQEIAISSAKLATGEKHDTCNCAEFGCLYRKLRWHIS